MSERLPLVALPSTLVEAGFEPVPYRRVYEAATGALIPILRSRSGRWTFDPSDLPLIAQGLGLTSAHAD